MDTVNEIRKPDAETKPRTSTTPEFRAQVDAFLDAAVTPDLQAAARQTTGLKSSRHACKVWQERLLLRGWVAPSWPVEFGGAGWTPAQRLYFENACADRDAPQLQSSGIRTIGPLIISEGTDAQKAYFLPAILRGDHEWCQGFSEPQAGSDLTALSLRAERDGDHFVLTGSKLWTSFAQYATHMFLLARTSASSTGADRLVFLLVEMDRPGVSVRPIRFIDGDCETNEVHFDQVRTPVYDRIGEIDEGWKVAKRLMAIARSNNTTTGLLRRAIRAAQAGLAETHGSSAWQSTSLASMALRLDAFEAHEARLSAAGRQPSPPAASALKILATELHQAITETGLDIAPHSMFAQAKYFATRAATIYSGTNEIHRNILAKAIGC